MGFFNFWNHAASGAPIAKDAPAPKGSTDAAAAPAEELKKEIERKGLDASNIDIAVEGGKVKLGGKAASTTDAEKIVLAVGNTKGVAQVESTIVVGKVETESVFYKVKPGDTLWKIAETQYGKGKGAKYGEIFDANRPLLSDPDKIYPGQVLRIPKLAGAPGEAKKG